MEGRYEKWVEKCRKVRAWTLTFVSANQRNIPRQGSDDIAVRLVGEFMS